MKKVGIIITALVLVIALCGGFYFVKVRSDAKSGENGELTKVQKLVTRNLDENYPATPSAVIKLIEQAQKLFDEELLANNPKDQLKASILADVKDYKSRSREISQTDVCDSDSVRFVTDKEKGDSLAYVQASYFVKEKKNYDRTYEMYVLRKDAAGKWKILTYYQLEGKDADDE